MNPLFLLGGLIGLVALVVNWDRLSDVGSSDPAVLAENAIQLDVGTYWYLVLNFANKLPGSAQALADDLATLLAGLGLDATFIRVLANADGVALNQTFLVVVDVEAPASLVTNRWFLIKTPTGESLRARVTRARQVTEQDSDDLRAEVLAQSGVTLRDYG